MVNNEWRLVISDALPGTLNMAFDEVLLDAVSNGESPPVLRFYRWEKPTLSLGYGQDIHSGVNLEFCQNVGLPVVRRITGGRAVIHDRELTYSLISPEKNSIFPGTINGNYSVIARALKVTMEKLGIAAEMAQGKRGKKIPEAQGYRHSACFISPSISELVVEGCKITGSAQIRRRGFFLQHGSIPVEMDLGLVARALNHGSRVSVERGEEYLRRKVGWLNRFSNEPVEIKALQKELGAAFSRCLGVRFDEGGFSGGEAARAEVLRREKYDNPLWNLQRKGSPSSSPR
jgi:lipoate-protein ligase A